MARKVIPLGERVVVKPVSAEEVRKSGLIMPDTAREKPEQGKVVAVGRGRMTESGKLIPLDLKVGDKVLFTKYTGQEWREDNEDYLIVRESDILTKLR
ncbi:MAG: co-chaperone GroES [Dehalococcoidia bacterium]|nr:co-chaperone GroES [Dehalococcoidia bacterium]